MEERNQESNFFGRVEVSSIIAILVIEEEREMSLGRHKIKNVTV